MKKANILKAQGTLKHKVAFLQTEMKLTGKVSLRGIFHDMDKVAMLLFTNKTPKEVSKIHRANNTHHVENNLVRTHKDYVEMVIDWECARITKPDKQLNAYDTLHKFYPQLQAQITPILIQFNINHSNMAS